MKARKLAEVAAGAEGCGVKNPSGAEIQRQRKGPECPMRSSGVLPSEKLMT